MKIGLVCPYNITRGGGVQECVLALQKELTVRGHTVKIITPTPPGQPKKHGRNLIFVGSAAEIKSPFHTTAQISASANPEELHLMLDNEQFDVLHFHEPWVPLLSRQLLYRSKTINIATFHAKLPETAMARTIEKVITPYTKSVLKYLHSLTAVSDSAAEYVRNLSSTPVTIIPNGINIGLYRQYINQEPSYSKRKKVILYVGRLEKRKGVKYLLKAYALLAKKYSHASLIIAGDGPDRQKLEELAKNWKLKNVKFLGFVSEKQKLNLFKKADVFSSPALYGESFGIVLLEAMATGTALVVGNNSGYSGVLKDRGALSLINPKDSVQFARKLELLLTDEALQQLWRSWAHEYVQQFDYSLIVSQYEQLYEKLRKLPKKPLKTKVMM